MVIYTLWCLKWHGIDVSLLYIKHMIMYYIKREVQHVYYGIGHPHLLLIY